jgi:hypothetical protein
MNEKADSLVRDVTGYYLDHSGYLLDQTRSVALYADQEIASGLQIVSQVLQACLDYGRDDLFEELNAGFSTVYSKYMVMKQNE